MDRCERTWEASRKNDKAKVGSGGGSSLAATAATIPEVPCVPTCTSKARYA